MGSLRLALAIAVLFSHLPLPEYRGMIAGDEAVKIFFAISGFYMSLISDRYRVTTLAGYRNFLMSRAAKIMPLYWLTIAISAVLATAQMIQWQLPSSISWEIGAIALLGHVFLLGQDFMRFLVIEGIPPTMSWTLFPETGPHIAGTELFLLGHTWTLASELLFYLSFGILAKLTWKWLLAVTLASWGLGRFVALSDMTFLAGASFFPAIFYWFAIGVLLGRLHPMALRLHIERFLGTNAQLCVWAFALLAVLTFHYFDAWRILIGDVKLLVVASLPIISVASQKWQADRRIGELSYPFYLLHYPIILVIHNVTLLSSWSMTIAAIGVTLLFSVMASVFVCAPIERWRHRTFVLSTK